MTSTLYTGARIFDGSTLSEGALLVTDGKVAGFGRSDQAADQTVTLDGGVIAPGFVDIQVNGGGGMMFNDAPDVATLNIMAQSHARLGATSILPTLITSSRETTLAAIEAAIEASSTIAGIRGIHLEGPHLSIARKGAHDAKYIRPMDADDLTTLCDAAQHLPALKVTVAPETVTPEQIAALTEAGICVSLGHSDAGTRLCNQAADAGARCVTHLFNAMSQLGNREPGLVGTALARGDLNAGLIADAVHAHPDSMRIALRAKNGPARIFLVSDAMAPAGTDIGWFEMDGRRIERRDGRLTLEDGTLAGADLDLATAVRNLVTLLDVPLSDALAMATSVPAGVAGIEDAGSLRADGPADFIHLDDDLRLTTTWRAGIRQ
ncbi:N-acetylglucosamine-6-phosphate deacetylase [Qingshengfaniella alkalisoli]|uniref:N-acetylglucosamine-6-phosphate deacetylase n=1 Tax=Qingshengfaniella alkalisoli TaxID=2599296 RepID=A0A5B8IAK4_9RHOB|nr:N-acetylglucosamine-6-phosphate deacetylase [Qingshengfaniella alkalisoli]QDY71535.1 N-acetylglucosamine-6-phosphate deacetylase [Qingshengfaniella alkalisoli]